MIYFDEDVARVNLLFAFFAPVMYLVFPEVRESKFHEHALPGAYYGPSRSTESENYCDVWNGTRFFAIHKGCLRIDERGVLALSSRTSKVAQPFTKDADADSAADLPNFDQWMTPALQKPISQYECKHGPWKKVLGFKFTCTNESVTMSAEHTIETMYNTYLINHPNFDAQSRFTASWTHCNLATGLRGFSPLVFSGEFHTPRL